MPHDATAARAHPTIVPPVTNATLTGGRAAGRGRGRRFGGLARAATRMMAMVSLAGQGDVFQRRTPGNVSRHTPPLAKGRGKAARRLDVS